MLFWQEGKVILYSFNPPFEVKDHFKCQPKFLLHNIGVALADVSTVIVNRSGKLSFFYVLDAEEGIEQKESNGTVYKNKLYSFFLHQYFESSDQDFIHEYLDHLKCEREKSSFILFSNIISTGLRLRPFATVIPLGKLILYKYKDNKKDASINDTRSLATWIDKSQQIPVFVERESNIIQSFKQLDGINSDRLEFISEEIGTQSARTLLTKMINRKLDGNKVELKSPNRIAFPGKEMTDEKERLKILKGIEYGFEDLSGESYFILNNTNFLRSNDSLSRLKVEEPIDHDQHRFVNVKSGQRLSRKIERISEVTNTDDYYETFNTTDGYEIDDGSGFSERAFYFQQTNLEKTVSLISEFRLAFLAPFPLIDFDKLGKVGWLYKIIPRKKKYVFRDGEVFHTSSKGLYHAGVLAIPKKLELQVLISKKTLELGGELKILEKINGAISFLYKDSVQSISKENLLVYDYNAFDHLSFSQQLDPAASLITYLVKPSESRHRLNLQQKEKVDSINRKVIDIVKNKSAGFVVVGEIDLYVFANAILKLGLRRGAVPWKIDAIDPNDKDHIFIGIDLGHNHRDRKSNLTLTAIDNEGCLIGSVTEKDLALKEDLSVALTQKVFRKIFSEISRKSVTIGGITIHRDGRFIENVDDFVRAVVVASNNPSLKMDVAEIVKTEVPLIGFKSGDHLLEAFEGLYFFQGDTSYLVTNDQSLATQTSPKPLKIRKVFGKKTVDQLTEEVFWLTKPYSVNLFTPSKLPLTTLLANNQAYSRNLLHFITA